MSSREVVFDFEKATKNTYRFQERSSGEPPIIGTLYVQKWLFKSEPKSIKLTIEWE
ncbi:MAG: hypothetical protein ACP5RZ_06205 [Thermoplasmata archaeon]